MNYLDFLFRNVSTCIMMPFFFFNNTNICFHFSKPASLQAIFSFAHGFIYKKVILFDLHIGLTVLVRH